MIYAVKALRKIYAGEPATGRDVHHDAPLSTLAFKQFQGTDAGYVAGQLFPPVAVDHETDRYYLIDPDSWLRIAPALRARRASPARVEFRVSSDAYAVRGYALAGEIALEDLANQDRAIRLREQTTALVVNMLARDRENRVASMVTSGTNLGSYVSLTGTAKWSDYTNSDPVSDVNSGHAFIESRTGLHANTLVLDKDTYRVVRRHPAVLEAAFGPGRAQGLPAADRLAEVFEVDRILVAAGVKNVAAETAPASLVNIWGYNAILAYVPDAVAGLDAVAFGVSFTWKPEGFPEPMQVLTYRDPDPGRATEVIQVQYWADEKIVGKDLSYGILGTL
ncbi:MAG: hypothetical protein QN183_13850 [Armatimonadota bacterium]|nr:hypothetical protein [Armatimonadota bacterium]